VVLTYLYRVHGADYYGGHEKRPHHFEEKDKVPRVVRGPEAGAGEGGLAEMGAVAARWARRAREGDTLVRAARAEDLAGRLEAWVERHCEKHDEDIWGCKVAKGRDLCNKKFRGKGFVIKHIHNKHKEELEAEQERAAEELYRDNYVEFFKRENEVQEEERRRLMEQAGGWGGRGRPPPPPRGPPGPPGMPVVPGPMGPMVVLPGPMGPMMQPLAGLMGPPMMPPGGGRGRGRGRGRGYHDVDAPSNNRPLLDYGDL